MKKRIAAILLILVFILALGACTSPTPTKSSVTSPTDGASEPMSPSASDPMDTSPSDPVSMVPDTTSPSAM